MTETELKLNKTSKLIGPKREYYDECEQNEKRLVTVCSNHRYPSKFCPRCRFYDVCKNKSHMC